MSLRFWACLGKKKSSRSKIEQSDTANDRGSALSGDMTGAVGSSPGCSFRPDPIEHDVERRNEPAYYSQYAKEVTDFSSQYGSETSISYTICNVAGRSNIYPTYGDFTNAGVFRTYGPWWKMVPNKGRKFRIPPNFLSDDFIGNKLFIAVEKEKLNEAEFL